MSFLLPLKKAYCKSWARYHANNPGKSFTQYEAADLFGENNTRCSTIDFDAVTSINRQLWSSGDSSSSAALSSSRGPSSSGAPSSSGSLSSSGGLPSSAAQSYSGDTSPPAASSFSANALRPLIPRVNWPLEIVLDHQWKALRRSHGTHTVDGSPYPLFQLWKSFIKVAGNTSWLKHPDKASRFAETKAAQTKTASKLEGVKSAPESGNKD